ANVYNIFESTICHFQLVLRYSKYTIDIADRIFGGCPIAEACRMEHSFETEVFIKLRPVNSGIRKIEIV
ncbi:MAG: hypothetical protein KBS53_00640, partial [Bacteroidales bacterium]|nr:hypothetical protein [Candidatus Hennigimonas equi]